MSSKAAYLPGGRYVSRPAPLIALLGLLSCLGPAAFDIYLPGVPTVARELDAPQWMAQATMGSYMIGLGLGQVLSGSISDILGRRRPLLLSLGLFVATSALCATAPTIVVLIAARFLQGATASAGLVISRSIIRDLHAGADGARMLSRIVMVYGLAPVLAPILGAQILAVTSWRGVFVFLMVLGGLLAIATALWLPETHRRDRRRTGIGETGTDLGLLFRTPSFLGFALVVGLSGAALTSFVATSAFVLRDHFGVSSTGFSALYGGMAVGMILGSQINAHLLSRWEPEPLLRIGILTATLNASAMLLAAALDAPLVAILPSFFLAMFTWGFIPTNAVALAMTDHPERAGSASSLIGLFQYGMSAIAIPIVGVFGSGSALPMAGALFVLNGLCLPVLLLYAAPHRSRALTRSQRPLCGECAMSGSNGRNG